MKGTLAQVPGKLSLLRPWADPDVLPGRRQDKCLDPGEHLGLGHRAAVRPLVTEAHPSPFPDDARPGAVDPAQARHNLGLPNGTSAFTSRTPRY